MIIVSDGSKSLRDIFQKESQKYEAMDEAIYFLKEYENIKAWNDKQDHTILHLDSDVRLYISENDEKWEADSIITCLNGHPATVLVFIEGDDVLISKILYDDCINKIETTDEILFMRGE